MTKDNRNNKYIWLGGVAILIMIIVSVLIYYFLFNKEETLISQDYDSTKSVALQCVSGSVEDSFFDGSNESEAKNVLKILFNNDKVERFFYNFEGKYASDSAAEYANAIMHGKYNKYMASKSMDPDSLKPTFSNSGDKMKVVLNANIDDINNGNIGFFFLSMDDFQHIRSYTLNDWMKLYKGKGFTCEKHE